MSTRVFDVGPAPTYGSAWSTAGSAINEGLSSVLGYYQQYQQQKRFEAQQQQDAKFKAMEMAERAEQNKAAREAREDAINQRRAAEWEKNAPLMTEEQAMQLPDYTEEAMLPKMSGLPDAPDEFGGPPSSQIQVGTEKKKQLLRSKKFGEYTGFADFGGQRAAAQKKQERIDTGQAVPATPELTAQLAKLGLGNFTDVVPQTVMGLYQQHLRDTSAEERDAARQASAEKIAANRDAAMLKKMTTSVADTADTIHPDLSGPELLDAITKENPGTGALLAGIVDGSIDPAKSASIRGNRRELLTSLAKRVDGSYDATIQPTRGKMRTDYATGDVSKNVRSINTAINHLGTLKDAVETLDPSSYPWLNKPINWFYDKTGSSKVTAVKTAMLATATEMAAALKGGRAAPSQTEIDEQLRVLDQTGSPEQWNKIIQQRGELLSARLNAARQGWIDTFGEEPKKPLIRTDTRKTMRRLGMEHLLEETGSADVPGEGGGHEAPNPFGLKRPGR